MTWKIVRQDTKKISADAVALPAGPEHLSRSTEEIPSAHGDQILAIYADVPEYSSSPEACGELQKYYACVLQIAEERHCCKIILPVPAGNWPADESLRIAQDILLERESAEDLEVLLCMEKSRSLLAEELHRKVAEYIRKKQERPRGMSRILRNRMFSPKEKIVFSEASYEDGCCEAACSASALDDVLARASETFQEMLFRKIDESGMRDPEVYKRANIDRKLFSKIRSNPDYRPKKDTVIALCIALELDIDDAKDLMRRAEYAFSPSRRKDLIVEYCIEQKLYDLMKINEILYDFHESSL